MSISGIYNELLSKAGTGPLSELFPLLLRLSKAMGNQQLEKWVLLELNGYYNNNPALTEDLIVPEYRTVAGQHSDEYGRPLVVTDPSLLIINENRLRNGVSELEHLLIRGKTVSFRDPYSAQIINRYFPDIEVGIFSFSSVLISGVLSGIRSKMIEWLHNIGPDIKKMDNSNLQSKSIDEQGTKVEKFFKIIKNHPVFAAIIIVGIFIIAIGNFADALDKIVLVSKNLYSKFSSEKIENTKIYTNGKTLQTTGQVSSYETSKKQNINLSTSGDQSSAVNASGGTVSFYYGISEKTYDELHELLKGQEKTIERLLKNLEEKDIILSERDNKINEWINKYKELESHIANRPIEEKFIVQAKEKLNNGDLEGAEKILKLSLENNLKLLEKTSKVAATAFELGSIKELQLDYKEAKNYFEYATQFDPQNTEYISEFGWILNELGDSKKAIEYYEKALKIDLQFYDDNHSNVARDYNNIGVTWNILGDSKKAIKYLEKALKINLQVFGEKHPEVANIYNNIGAVWYNLGDSKKTIEYCEKALKINLQVYGDNHSKVASAYNNIGAAWDKLGDLKKAIEYYEKALKINLQVYGGKHPNVAIEYNNIGVACDSLGDLKKAIEYYDKAYKIYLNVYGNDYPFTKDLKYRIEIIKKQ